LTNDFYTKFGEVKGGKQNKTAMGLNIKLPWLPKIIEFLEKTFYKIKKRYRKI
jgi:hypothetical protein